MRNGDGAGRRRRSYRVGDAAAGCRFTHSQWVDRTAMLLRGHGWQPLYCRPLAQWIAKLEALGFVVAPQPMSDGTLFANVLLVATVAASA